MMTPLDVEETRTTRKRRAIVEAATSLFLEQGYDGTSMDQVAARAAVSKQTVYKQFADKERLFAEVVLRLSGTVDAFVETVTDVLARPKDVEKALIRVGRLYLETVMQPAVLSLRRLLIAEASRFPQLGRAYYERVPRRTVMALAGCFEQLVAQGALRPADPVLAAQHYAFLVLSIPMDEALLCGEAGFSAAELDRLADAGVGVFLAAYGPSGTDEKRPQAAEPGSSSASSSPLPRR